MPPAAPAVNSLPLIHVDAASVSLAPDGGYDLLLHTSEGRARFRVPLAVGLHVFQITNPAAPASAHMGKQPIRKPSGRLL